MLTEKQLAEFYSLFKVPDQFHEEALAMVREDEVLLVTIMGDKTWTAKELEPIIFENFFSFEPNVYIHEKYKRVILDKVELEGGEIGYKITNMYRRYPHYAQFEPYYYRKLSREVKDALNAWDLEVYDVYKGPVIEARKAGDYSHPIEQSDYLTLEEALLGIERHDGLINVVPCNCSAMEDKLEAKYINRCMHFLKPRINGDYDRGLGTVLTKEEAIELVKKFNKWGFMQCGEFDGYCNCYADDCYPQKLAWKHDSRFHYPRPHYDISHDEAACINCGKCAKLCNFKAFTKGEDGKVRYDADKCWQCTMCVSNCPKKCIIATKKDNDIFEIPNYHKNDDFMDNYLKVGSEI